MNDAWEMGIGVGDRVNKLGLASGLAHQNKSVNKLEHASGLALQKKRHASGLAHQSGACQRTGTPNCGVPADWHTKTRGTPADWHTKRGHASGPMPARYRVVFAPKISPGYQFEGHFAAPRKLPPTGNSLKTVPGFASVFSQPKSVTSYVTLSVTSYVTISVTKTRV